MGDRVRSGLQPGETCGSRGRDINHLDIWTQLEFTDPDLEVGGTQSAVFQFCRVFEVSHVPTRGPSIFD